jgi:endonuclease/exonuclease/phosphatase family metal-dependent hydrolase
MAENLRNVIEELCGRKLSMLSDGRPGTESGKEILIGYSSRVDNTSVSFRQAIRNIKNNEYLIYGEDGNVYVGGRQGSAVSLTAAVNALVKALRTTGDAERIVLDYTNPSATKIAGRTYSMMSYNDGDNSYGNVDDRVEVVSAYMPDILCFQETQLLHSKVYKARFEVYDYVYFDNDGTTYNSQPIYYKRDMFELLDSGIQWLSDTPDERSKYQESDYIRSFTYAVLKDKETGMEIVIVNTHIDYLSAATAKQTARLIELTERFRDRPVFYFGDFNMQRDSVGYNNMINAGLNDTGRALGNTQSVIDFCFFDRALVLPSKYKVVNDHELSSIASDHPAIYSEVMIVE